MGERGLTIISDILTDRTAYCTDYLKPMLY